MTGSDPRPCSLRYVRGYHIDESCHYPARFVVVLAYRQPFLACGYHSRAYTADVIYVLRGANR